MRHKTGFLIATVTVLSGALLPQESEGEVPQDWRVYISKKAPLQFEVPNDWNVYERQLSYVLEFGSPRSLLIFKVVPGETSEETLLTKPAQIQIHIEYLEEAATLDELVSQKYPPRLSDLIEEEKLEVAGNAALLRKSKSKMGPTTDVFLIRDRRKYHFTFRQEPENEFIFQHLLDTMEFKIDRTVSPKDNVASAAAPSEKKVVRLIYLIPSDKPRREDYTVAIETAIRHVRFWYRDQMLPAPLSQTFILHEPVVEIYQTSHQANWYSENDPDTGGVYQTWFWENVLRDGFALTGAEFDDPVNRWIFYVDADPKCGQIGGGGTSGVAVLPANDLRGLTKQPHVPPCPAELPDTAGVCRWVGGLAHELGHGFDLPHPAECEDNDPATLCNTNALMWLGYRNYASTFLLGCEKDQLDQSPFFSPIFPFPPLFDCSSLHYLAGRWEAKLDLNFLKCKTAHPPLPIGLPAGHSVADHTYSVIQIGDALQGFSLDDPKAEILGTINGDSVTLTLKECFPGDCSRTFNLQGSVTNRTLSGSIAGSNDDPIACGTCSLSGSFEITVSESDILNIMSHLEHKPCTLQ